MIKIAVLLTVYNRCAVTLKGLGSLYKAIGTLGEGYAFDIYMTDDGCTDGTPDAVAKEFSEVHIIQGDGNLYWSGGMRKAWQTSIDSGNDYDFFLWFNDDVDLYEDALISLFEVYNNESECIVTGAFCDHDGKASYGGKLEEFHILEPNGQYQDVTLMNGNLVLIPFIVYSKLGKIDKNFKHGLGDYDYGRRAQKNNFKVKLTAKYVGVCDRHDEIIPRYYSCQLSLMERIRQSYGSRDSIKSYFVYFMRYEGLVYAIKYFITRNFYTLFPRVVNKEYK